MDKAPFAIWRAARISRLPRKEPLEEIADQALLVSRDSAGLALDGALDVFIAAEFDNYKIKVGKVKFKL